MDRKAEDIMYTSRYNDRIQQLESEVKDKEEEIEISNDKRVVELEEEIYNTKQSIEELKKYV
jgi:peptidoglycan hydrolase CwlO-like protein